jgi:glycosyltransferase involved in cell wall biosynthesis
MNRRSQSRFTGYSISSVSRSTDVLLEDMRVTTGTTAAPRSSDRVASATAPRKPVVLVVGQTPPPYGGQALMIEHLVRARFDRIQVHHIRLAFSGSMASIGRAELRKVWHLLAVLFRAARVRLGRRVDLLWFAPAGPNAVPVLRDVVLLGVLRALYPRVVLHFHAAGLSVFLDGHRPFLRRLALLAYGAPDGAIQTSGRNPADAAYLRARRSAVIPNGIPDQASDVPARDRPADEPVRVLYVGKLDESKGVLVLLESVRILARRTPKFSLWLMGEFASQRFEDACRRFCAEYRLESVVQPLGQRIGDDKWDVFRRADILCFPSFFEAESFGNVALEGMMFGLPVVATRWRGIPDLVEDGETGLLVPVKDPTALAAALERLITDPQRRRLMGASGRRRYLAEFTIERHLARMEAFLGDLAVAP